VQEKRWGVYIRAHNIHRFAPPSFSPSPCPPLLRTTRQISFGSPHTRIQKPPTRFALLHPFLVPTPEQDLFCFSVLHLFKVDIDSPRRFRLRISHTCVSYLNQINPHYFLFLYVLLTQQPSVQLVMLSPCTDVLCFTIIHSTILLSPQEFVLERTIYTLCKAHSWSGLDLNFICKHICLSAGCVLGWLEDF
jgi:hypothetical protein